MVYNPDPNEPSRLPHMAVSDVSLKHSPYVVQEGDTLPGIAQKHYGTVAGWQKIYNANTDKVETPSVIVPGTTLHIPN